MQVSCMSEASAALFIGPRARMPGSSLVEDSNKSISVASAFGVRLLKPCWTLHAVHRVPWLPSRLGEQPASCLAQQAHEADGGLYLRSCSRATSLDGILERARAPSARS